MSGFWIKSLQIGRYDLLTLKICICDYVTEVNVLPFLLVLQGMNHGLVIYLCASVDMGVANFFACELVQNDRLVKKSSNLDCLGRVGH